MDDFSDVPLSELEAIALSDEPLAALEASSITPDSPVYTVLRLALLEDDGPPTEEEEALTYSDVLAPPFRARHRMRQALRKWGDDEESREALLSLLRPALRFDYSPDLPVAEAEKSLPSVLDEESVSTDAFLERLLSGGSPAYGVEPYYLPSLLEQAAMSSISCLAALDLLTTPDVEGLPSIVAGDARQRSSHARFGDRAVHARMTLAQLRETALLWPEARNSSAFVEAFLARLQPAGGHCPRGSPERAAYLDAVLAAVTEVGTESAIWLRVRLTALLLRLDEQVLAAAIDRDTVADILALVSASVGSPYSLPGVGPAGSSATMIQAALQQLAAAGVDVVTMFGGSLDAHQLQRQLLQQSIKSGSLEGDALAAAFASLPESTANELRSSSRLAFKATELGLPLLLPPGDEELSLDIVVKNMAVVSVSLFELNAAAYYRDKLEELPSDLQLDGLLASHTQELAFDGVLPHVETTRCIRLPTSRRGVYIVELMGGGQAVRAVLRRGRLTMLTRVTAAGHEVTLLDEDGAQLPADRASVWMAGRQYRAEAGGDGCLLLPFTSSPGGATAVIQLDAPAGSDELPFASLAHFQHEAETYSLMAAFTLPRESLLADNRRAKLMLSLRLSLAGVPVSLSLLQQAELTIVSVDAKGTEARKVLSDLALSDDGDLLQKLPVPDELRRLQLSFTASVTRLDGSKQQLSASKTIELNGQRSGEDIQDWQLRPSPAGDGSWQAFVFGRTGEPRSAVTVSVTLKHSCFTAPHTVSLSTDAAGLIHLGHLHGIASVAIDGAHPVQLQESHIAYPPRICLLAGEQLRLPLLRRGSSSLKPARDAVSLLRYSNGLCVEDAFPALAYDGAFLTAELPAGTYTLQLKRVAQSIDVTVTAGDTVGSWLIPSDPAAAPLEMAERSQPLAVTDIVALYSEGKAADEVVISIAGADDDTRVHVFATHFAPLQSLDGVVAIEQRKQLAVGEPRVLPASTVLPARRLGDEARYVLDRKRLAVARAGIMLPQPGLLLDPWAVTTTTASAEELQADEPMRDRLAHSQLLRSRAAMPRPAGSRSSRAIARGASYCCLDFLSQPGVLVGNLPVGAGGTVVLPAADLGCDADGAKLYVHVIAFGEGAAATLSLPLRSLPAAMTAAAAAPWRDLRLIHALEADGHYTQRKLVTAVAGGEEIVVQNAGSATVQAFDSVSKLLSLLTTLHKGSDGDKLSDFSWLPTWPTLTHEQRLSKYDKYACHELHLFLYHRDRAFFDAVVRPALACKFEKTFIDLWLLGNDLSAFLAPAAFMKLNFAERCLLAVVQPDAAASIAAHVADAVAGKPDSAAAFAARFRTAVADSALDDDAGEMARLLESAAPPPPPAMAAPEAAFAFGGMGGGGGGRGGVLGLSKGAFLADEAKMPKLKAKKHKRKAGKRRSVAAEDRRRRAPAALYTPAPKTMEYAESNYYKVRNSAATAGRVAANGFWADFSAYVAGGMAGSFQSARFAEAARNFTEIACVLALSDAVPFAVAEPAAMSLEEGALHLQPSSGLVLFHEEIRPAEASVDGSILLAQHYFDPADATRTVGGRKVEKYISTGEFLPGRVYGCKVVLTNISSASLRVTLLTQIPRGAMAVGSSEVTHSGELSLASYAAESYSYRFYFPCCGSFSHFPAHVADGERLLAFAEASELSVVPRLSSVDLTSWPAVSQAGSNDDVLSFLSEQPLASVDLTAIRWRMSDAAFWRRTLDVLDGRRHCEPELWKFAVLHGDAARLAEYVALPSAACSGSASPQLSSPLLTVDAKLERLYEHLAYMPLVNARAHAVGKERKILNRELQQQYRRTLVLRLHSRVHSAEQTMALIYYLLLQDRTADALRVFRSKLLSADAAAAAFDDDGNMTSVPPPPAGLVSTLQFNYLVAYLDFFSDKHAVAREVAAAYADYPVLKWRRRFRAVLAQLDEVDSSSSGSGSGKEEEKGEEKKEEAAGDGDDGDDRIAKLSKLADAAPSLHVDSNGDGQLRLTTSNIDAVQLHFHRMDVELLFSSSPFVAKDSGSIAYVRPNLRTTVAVGGDGEETVVAMPEEMRGVDVVVRATAAGLSSSVTIYSNRMQLQHARNQGQLRVYDSTTRRPLPRVYVKVFAQLKGSSEAKFYKDGYTDLRGAFDYASVSSHLSGRAAKFAILLASSEHGSLVLTSQPPKM